MSCPLSTPWRLATLLTGGAHSTRLDAVAGFGFEEWGGGADGKGDDGREGEVMEGFGRP